MLLLKNLWKDVIIEELFPDNYGLIMHATGMLV